MEQARFDREALIAEVAKRHKILLDPDDPAFALITINEIVLSRAIAIVEAQLKEMVSEVCSHLGAAGRDSEGDRRSHHNRRRCLRRRAAQRCWRDLIEKVRTSIGPEQAGKQSESRFLAT